GGECHTVRAFANGERALKFALVIEGYVAEMRQFFAIANRHPVRLFLLIALCAFAPAPAAEVLSYEFVVNEIAICLHIDTYARTVQQVAREGSVTEVGRYSDGVFGPVSHAGAAALIPPVHQFVRIIDEKILYGAELHGVEDRAVLDRRLATITLANGKAGWCRETK